MHFVKRHILLFIALVSVSVVLFLFSRQRHVATRSSVIQNVTHNVRNLGKFRYDLLPQCSKKSIIWLVTSYAGNAEKRSALRETYPQEELDTLDIQRVFLLGEFPAFQIIQQRSVDIESSIYHDIVQGRFIEAYKNLTYKHLMGLNWVSQHCDEKSIIVKMDDDIVINIYDLLPKLFRKEEYFIMGYALRKMKPKRDPENKWFITRSEFEREEFPDFVSGWLYMTNVRTAQKLVSESQKHEHFFWIDDVFVTGVLREQLDIQLIDVHEIFATDYRFLECCIKGMIKNRKCEFIAGPDGAQNELLSHFKNYAKFCYDNSCALWYVGKRCVVVFKEKQIHGQGKASVHILQT